ncbi:hypothetical protein LINGRAHAP2_LOCUS4658 [Linum grandiflorum]
MCTGSGAESREGGGGGIINSDNWISKSDDDHQDGEEDQNFQISGVAESTMKARTSSGGAGGLHGIIRRLPLNAHLGKLPLHEVGEEVVSLGRIACPIILTTLLIHSRRLHHERLIGWDGSHLRSSLWCKEMGSSQPNIPENAMSSPFCFHLTNLPLMGQPGAYIPAIRSGS